MNYKVGDKVLINSRLVALPEVKYGGHCVNELMLQFCGKVCTIAKVEHYILNGRECYRIKEDGEKWAWTVEMIDGKVNYKVGDKVRIRNDLIPFGQYGTESFTPEMEPFKGTVCTIDHKTIRRNGKECYRIKEDGGKWGWTPEMIEERVPYFSYTLIENDEERKTTKELVKEIMARGGGKQKEMEHLLKRTKSLYRNTSYGAFTEPKTAMEIEGFEINPHDTDEEVRKKLDKAWGKELEKMLKSIKIQERIQKLEAILKQENKENKEDIEMSNTQLIENKLEKELRALKKARNEEIKNKFYETTIGKAAKAFNEALEQDGNEDQKEYSMIDIDDLMERGEENFAKEINAEYDAKSLETKEYYAEAKNLFENADTYEQKHEILTAYGILKGPKVKAKVEAK